MSHEGCAPTALEIKMEMSALCLIGSVRCSALTLTYFCHWSGVKTFRLLTLTAKEAPRV
jgi:hypothetical protein